MDDDMQCNKTVSSALNVLSRPQRERKNKSFHGFETSSSRKGPNPIHSRTPSSDRKQKTPKPAEGLLAVNKSLSRSIDHSISDNSWREISSSSQHSGSENASNGATLSIKRPQKRGRKSTVSRGDEGGCGEERDKETAAHTKQDSESFLTPRARLGKQNLSKGDTQIGKKSSHPDDQPMQSLMDTEAIPKSIDTPSSTADSVLCDESFLALSPTSQLSTAVQLIRKRGRKSQKSLNSESMAGSMVSDKSEAILTEETLGRPKNSSRPVVQSILPNRSDETLPEEGRNIEKKDLGKEGNHFREDDNVMQTVKKKRGRPPKEEGENVMQTIKKKRGRPPKTKQSSDVAFVSNSQSSSEALQSQTLVDTPASQRGKRQSKSNPKYVDESSERFQTLEDTPTPQRGRRKREKNPKYVDHSQTESDEEEDDKPDGDEKKETNSVEVKKKRGRPPKNAASNIKEQASDTPKSSRRKAKRPKYVEMSSGESEEQSSESSDASENNQAEVVIKRKRGRPPSVKPLSGSGKGVKKKRKKIVSSESEESSDEEDSYSESVNKDSGEQKEGGKASKLVTCLVCNETSTSIQMHMMKQHSLWYTRECPKGESKPNEIIKRLGFVVCQQCQKKFRFAQYYKFHLDWCGREDEMAVCDICNNTLRAMWLNQHLKEHARKKEREEALKEKKKTMALEAKQREAEQDKEVLRSDGMPVRSKRRAAKSALKFMADNTDEKGDGQFSDCDDSGKSAKDLTSASDDDDDDTEGDNEEDTEENRVEGKHSTKSSNRKKLKRWGPLFVPQIKKRALSHLEKLQEFEKSISQEPLFEGLQPTKMNWKPLEDGQTSAYLPYKTSSVNFATTTRGNADWNEGEGDMSRQRLHWGQSCGTEGTSYCFAGAAIWGLEWCPLPEGADSNQILAVAVDSKEDYLTSNRVTPGPGVIQLWSLYRIGIKEEKEEQRKSQGERKSQEDETAQFCEGIQELSPKLRVCLAHNSGSVRSMSWCPRRAFVKGPSKEGFYPRLGLLAVACSDSHVLIYSVPKVEALLSDSKDTESTLVVKPKAAITLKLRSKPEWFGPALSVAWQEGGDCRYVAAGYGNGCTVIWDLECTSPLLRANDTDGNVTLQPFRYYYYHSGPILSLAWCRHLPNILMSSGMDYTLCLTDITRVSMRPMDELRMHPNIYRRIRSMGPYYVGWLAADETLSLSGQCGLSYGGLCYALLERKRDNSFVILSGNATAWDVDYCPYSEIAVSCDASGEIRVFLFEVNKVTLLVPQTRVTFKAQAPTAILYKVQPVKLQEQDNQEKGNLTQPDGNVEAKLRACIKELAGDLGVELNEMKEELAGDEMQSSVHETTAHFPSVSQSGSKDAVCNVKSSHSIKDVNPVETSLKQNTVSEQINGTELTHDSEAQRDEVVFNNTSELTFKPSREEKGSGQEDLRKLNTRSIQRVRLNVNVGHCSWLATGGQAGILRVDDLASLLTKQRPHIRKLRTSSSS